MHTTRLDVSTLFDARRRHESGPSEDALHAAMLEPALGPVRLEDRGEQIRLWVFDGGWMDVPKSLTRLIGRWRNWVKIDLNGETVVLELADDELAAGTADIFRPLAIAG
jgi:hypothetical protein